MAHHDESAPRDPASKSGARPDAARAASTEPAPAPTGASRGPNLRRGGFSALIVTQFFGAANDNILKGVLGFAVAAGGVWEAALGSGGQGWVGLCLTIPFIVFGGWAGQIADRVSKRDLTIGLKYAEVGTVTVAAIAFMAGSVWLAVASMILLATQSTFFGPAKYGAIPELVSDSRLSGANGAINLFTNLAIIAGTVVAGPVYDEFAPAGAAEGATWLPGAVLIAVAVLGVVASYGIPPLRAAMPELRFDWNPMAAYTSSLRAMAKGPLLAVTLAWSFFYFLGMLVLLILPDYRELLGVDAAVAANLLGVVAISIGIGCLVAGLVSGRTVRPGMAPWGAFGMAVSMAVVAVAPKDAVAVGLLLVPVGISTGFYIVPLQTMLQKLSPEDSRGRFLGTANAVSFVASSLASIVFIGLREEGMAANRIFLVAAAASLMAAIGMGWWWMAVGRRQTEGRL